MRAYILAIGIVFALATPGSAELLGKEWIDEAEMKHQSRFAKKHGLLLMDLSCRFKDGVENPGRTDVLFRADFEQPSQPVGWGWTFDANAPNLAAEAQAQQAGFVMAGEDYFEISGVTWVRCKVWHHPGVSQ
ncbi:MAG: hypothetical protein AAF478_10605 [Pseudomonadota bacterium]